MKILITGASGFIGGALARGLLQAGDYEVIGQYRTLLPENHSMASKWIQCDLTQEVYCDEDIDYIVHCSAIQDYKGMPARDFIDTNLSMTENIANFGKKKGVKGLIFISSIELHGQIRDAIVDENTDRINPSVYGISKYVSELVFKEYQGFFPTVALRLCGVVGRGAKNIWLANVLSKAKSGEDIGIVNSERFFNNIVHSDDLLNFMIMLMNYGFSGYNAFPIASKTPISIRDVVTEIIRSTHSASRIIDNGLTKTSFLISNNLAMNKYGYAPLDVVTNLNKFVRDMQ